MTTRRLYRLAGLAVFLCVYALSAYASKTTLTGTITDSFGTGVNGTLIMRLPVPAQDTTSNVAVSNIPVTFRLVNGAIQGGAQLYDVVNLQPQNLYYIARAYDTSGNLVFAGNYAVTGGSFNLGAATPTSVTTSNISYLNPVSATANTTFTGTDVFTNINLIPPGTSNNNIVQLLSAQGPQAPITGSGAAQNIYSYTLPANTLRVGGLLYIYCAWSHSTGSGSVTYTTTFGGTQIQTNTSSGTAGQYADAHVFVTGASSELSTNSYGTQTTFTGPGFTTPAAAIASPITITFTFNAAGTEQVTPELFYVQLVQ